MFLGYKVILGLMFQWIQHMLKKVYLILYTIVPIVNSFVLTWFISLIYFHSKFTVPWCIIIKCNFRQAIIFWPSYFSHHILASFVVLLPIICLIIWFSDRLIMSIPSLCLMKVILETPLDIERYDIYQHIVYVDWMNTLCKPLSQYLLWHK